MSIRWSGTLLSRLRQAERDMPRNLASSIQPAMQVTIEYARAQAPWQDRTGDARRGLHVETQVSGSKVNAIIAHGVDYGIDLERRGLGILEPALHYMKSRIQKDVSIFK